MSDNQTAVRLPRLLDAQLHPVRILHPVPLTINEKLSGTSEATMRLASDEEVPALRDFVRLYTQHGDAGVWRVSSMSRSPATGETTVTLLHGRDLFSDCVLLEQGDFSGTAAQLLAKVINAQTAFIGQTAFWTLGTVASVNVEPRSLNFDRCSSVLDSLENELTDYRFTYDMSGFPWVLGLAPKGTDVTSEFRMSRNIDKVNITMNDADLCTRLIVSAHHEKTTPQQGGPTDPTHDDQYITTGGTQDIMRIFTYQSTSAIDNWGVAVKTADIDVTDNLTAGTQPGVIDVDTQQSSGYPATDAWARAFIAMRQRPTLQIQLSGRELCRRSGCTLDQITLGMLSRVNLVEYNDCWEERVVSINRPDVIGDPENVSVSMANTLPKFTESIARIRQQTESNTASSRSSRRSRSVLEKEVTHWQQVVTRTWDAVDGTGLKELHETGVVIDTETGAKIYSLIQGDQSMLGMIKVNAGEIELRVQKDGVISAINQTAEQITIDASKIGISAGGTGISLDSSTGVITINAAAQASEIIQAVNGSRSTNKIVLDADHVYIDSAKKATIGDVMTITTGGGLWVQRIAQFGASGGNIVSVNNGTVNAPTLQVNTGGNLTFSPGQGGTAINISHSTAASLLTGVQIAGPTNNVYTLQYQMLGTGSTWNNAQVTFSRAITSFNAVGGSGTITVTASPQAQDYTLIHAVKSVPVNGELSSNCTSNVYKVSETAGNIVDAKTIFLYHNTTANTVEARIGTSAAAGTAVAKIAVSGGGGTPTVKYFANSDWHVLSPNSDDSNPTYIASNNPHFQVYSGSTLTHRFAVNVGSPANVQSKALGTVLAGQEYTVTPDSGYDYLTEVTFTTPSGGGGGSPSFFIAASEIGSSVAWENYSPISTSDTTSTSNTNSLTGYKYLGVSGGQGIYKFTIPSSSSSNNRTVTSVSLAPYYPGGSSYSQGTRFTFNYSSGSSSSFTSIQHTTTSSATCTPM